MLECNSSRDTSLQVHESLISTKGSDERDMDHGQGASPVQARLEGQQTWLAAVESGPTLLASCVLS